MKQLEEVLKEFRFSDEFKQVLSSSDTYEIYTAIPDSVNIEIEQQGVISTNNIIYNSN